MANLSAIQQRIGARLTAIGRAIAGKAIDAPAVTQVAPDFFGMGEVGRTLLDPWMRTAKLWQMAADRYGQHAFRDRMDAEDELISKALDVTSDIVASPMEGADARRAFEVECEDEVILEEVERFVSAVRLREDTAGLARRICKYGNEFREPVLDVSGSTVARFKRLPEESLFPQLDEFGRPLEAPWEQRNRWQAPGAGIQFAPWQIVHYAYPPEDEFSFGRGILNFELTWQRLQATEDGMVMMRLHRAGDRLLHKVAIDARAGTAEADAQMTAYITRWQTRRVQDAVHGTSLRDNPNSAWQDIYLPVYPDTQAQQSDVALISPQNAQLRDIRDVEYLRARMLARLGVPARYLNLGGAEAVRASLGDGGISYEDIQFARMGRGIQSVIVTGHLRVILLHLILRGFNPLDTTINLLMPSISTADAKREAEVEKLRAEAAAVIGGLLALPAEFILDRYVRLTPDEREQFFSKVQIAAMAVAQAKAVADKAAAAAAAKAPPTQQPGPPPQTQSLREIADAVTALAGEHLGLLELGEVGYDHDHAAGGNGGAWYAVPRPTPAPRG